MRSIRAAWPSFATLVVTFGLRDADAGCTTIHSIPRAHSETGAMSPHARRVSAARLGPSILRDEGTRETVRLAGEEEPATRAFPEYGIDRAELAYGHQGALGDLAHAAARRSAALVTGMRRTG
jgi:hypothetical protein